MALCKISAHMKPLRMERGSALSDADVYACVSVCETHGWQFFDGHAVGSDHLCPIGRIEAATDEAIRKIREVAV